MLDFAEKYNWWTPVDLKKNISVEAKIEYLLTYGTLDELRKMYKEVNGDQVHAVWEKVFAHHPMLLKKRRKTIEYLVTSRRNDRIR